LETREIFDAAPLAVGQFLSETGQGLYIPPYQRNYSWEPVKVRRLIEDVVHGLSQLKDMADSICFLGTVIALRDLTYVTVEPIHRPQVPAKVMTIIDGQQRLTTLVLITTVLHEEIRLRAARLDRSTPGEAWLKDQASNTTGLLATTYEEDMRYGDKEYRFYPRLIRAYYDGWSRNSGEALYTSPAGYYLHKYGLHARQEPEERAYQHEPLLLGQVDEPNAEAHKHFARIRTEVRRLLRRLANAERAEDGDDDVIPGIDVLIANELIQLGLFNSALPDDTKESLAEVQNDGLARLIILAQYLLQRVTVAVVTAKREEYGFDMFEALNTTGEPLTAIETFKPRAIQVEGLNGWKDSESKASFDVVDAHLDRLGRSSTDRRQSATSALLTPFALAQSGSKLGKRLNEQRHYLRTQFEEQGSSEGKRKFLRMLAQVVKFQEGPWSDPEKLPDSSDRQLLTEAGVSLAALKDGSHDIVIAPLVRYYAAYRLCGGGDEDRAHRGAEFLRIVKSAAAFYALWRGAHTGTSGIDDVWRRVMSGDHSFDLKPLARRSKDITDVPTVADLNKYLVHQLEARKLAERDRWIRAASMVPVGQWVSLTKFLLLAASHDSTPDAEKAGLVVRGRSGLLPMLTVGRWVDQMTLTVEHVAPQNPSDNSGWDASLYESPELVNQLGNLTLLPTSENSSASNRSWPIKRLLYRAYSADTIDEAEALLVSASESGLELSRSSQKIIHDSKFLPLVSAIGKKDTEWTADFVRERSERLAGLIWDVFWSWISSSLSG
jgi:hypothetical protein